MSVGNTRENKLQKCNGLLELRSLTFLHRVVKESLAEQRPKGGGSREELCKYLD